MTEKFVFLLNQNQLNGIKILLKTLENKNCYAQEIEDICQKYKVSLTLGVLSCSTFYFSNLCDVKAYEKLLPRVAEKYFKEEIWNLLIDQGDYTKEELEEIFYNAFYNIKRQIKKDHQQIFEFFTSKQIQLKEPNLDKHGSGTLPYFHKLIIDHCQQKRHDLYFYEYLKQEFDVTQNDKNGNPYLHNLCRYSNDVRNFIILDPLSKKYIFQKNMSLLDSKGNTIYHLLFSDFSKYNVCATSKKFNLGHFVKYLGNFSQKKHDTCGINIFTHKNNKGFTVCDLIVKTHKKWKDNTFIKFGIGKSQINELKTILQFFKYDFSNDPKCIKKYFP